MKVTAAVLALVAISFSTAPVMASVASSSGSDIVVQAKKGHKHHKKHALADQVRVDLADGASAIG
jgi:hypothetical protein